MQDAGECGQAAALQEMYPRLIRTSVSRIKIVRLGSVALPMDQISSSLLFPLPSRQLF